MANETINLHFSCYTVGVCVTVAVLAEDDRRTVAVQQSAVESHALMASSSGCGGYNCCPSIVGKTPALFDGDFSQANLGHQTPVYGKGCGLFAPGWRARSTIQDGTSLALLTNSEAS